MSTGKDERFANPLLRNYTTWTSEPVFVESVGSSPNLMVRAVARQSRPGRQVLPAGLDLGGDVDYCAVQAWRGSNTAQYTSAQEKETGKWF